jgi:predicted nucleic acid-binding protein
LEGAQIALQTYEQDWAKGVYHSVLLVREHFVSAALALDLGGPLRAGDALHLGAARVADLPLVTSDKTLYDIANVSRLDVSYLPNNAQ